MSVSSVLARPGNRPTEAESGAFARSAAATDITGAPDAEAVDVLRSSSLIGLAVPEEYGGAGADALTLNRCVEEVASVNASLAIMLFQHFAVTSRVVEQGTPDQRRDILPRLASGEWLAASAWSESGAGANKRNLATKAVGTGTGWVLDGAKAFTTSAGVADVYLVLAQTSDPADDDRSAYGSAGQTFFLIPSTNPGLIPDTSMSLTGMRGSATGFVSLRDCHVGDDTRLGPLGSAASIIATVRESGATLGAVAVGIAAAALRVAEGHARKRGLLDHEALRYRLVDLATEVEAARAIVERAGRRESDQVGHVTLHSKLYASAAAERVCASVATMLGSAGYVDSHPINRLARDARAVALMGPTNDLCRELLSWKS